MRIEVLVENEDPKVFPLNREKIVIGSGDQCDIMLEHSGISRKHLSVLSEGDKYFVIDQGSTNGSYLNEERLVPGRKVEFTSFFPVRLGDNVLLTLLSDDDANSFAFESPINELAARERTSPNIQKPVFNEQTRTISIKDLHEFKTETLVKKRIQRVEKSRAKAPKAGPVNDKSRMLFVKVGCVLLFGFAVYYNLFLIEPTETTMVKEPEVNIEQTAPVPAAPVYALVDQADLTPKEKFKDMQSSMSCSTNIEKYLCDAFPEHEAKAVQVGTMVNLFHDGSTVFEEAKNLMPLPKTEVNPALASASEKTYQQDLRYVAMILFLTNKFKKEMDLAFLSGLKITIILKIPNPENDQDYVAAAFVPESYNKFLLAAQPNTVEQVKKYGSGAVNFLKSYMSYY